MLRSGDMLVWLPALHQLRWAGLAVPVQHYLAMHKSSLAEPALCSRLRYNGHFGTLMPFYRAWDKLSRIQDPLKPPKKVSEGSRQGQGPACMCHMLWSLHTSIRHSPAVLIPTDQQVMLMDSGATSARLQQPATECCRCAEALKSVVMAACCCRCLWQMPAQCRPAAGWH